MALRLFYFDFDDSNINPDFIQEDEELFSELIKSKLLSYDNKTNSLKIPSEDFLLIKKAKKAENPKLPELSKEDIYHGRLVNKLYYSLVGAYVKNQIKIWNNTRKIVGIRDNRTQKNSSYDNQWSIINSKLSYKKLPKMTLNFGLINNNMLIKGFSNWLTVHNLKPEPIHFQTRIDLDKQIDLQVQVIGIPDFIEVDNKEKNVSKNCYIYMPESNKKSDSKDDEPFGALLKITLKPGKHVIKIGLKSVNNLAVSEPGLHIQAITNNDKTKRTLKWQGCKKRESVLSKFPLTIFTEDDVPITDKNGYPTQDAIENGLIHLSGIARQTPYKLYSMLSRSNIVLKTDKVFLTINSKMQSIAQKQLQDHVKKLCKNDKYQKLRKASVVIIDSESGDILSIANLPEYPKNINLWDILAFEKFYNQKNPMKLQAWKGIGIHSSPASTFKPFIALYALISAKNRFKDANNILQDYDSYMRKNSNLYKNLNKILNFYNSRNISDHSKKIISQCFKESIQKKFKLNTAITFSKNIWFQWLAVLLDGQKAFEYDYEYFTNSKPSKLPDFQINKIAQKFDLITSPIDLAPELPRHIRLYPIPEKADGDVLFANPIDFEIMKDTPNMLLKLIETAQGHCVSASPLYMARIAAMISSGKLIIPYLFRKDSNLIVNRKEPVKIDIKEDYLELLQNAMHKVVETGTAKNKFNDYSLKKFLYGKTGTAQIKNNKNKVLWYTAWFIGFQKASHENKNNKKLKRNIAFACIITHANGSGADVCAPLIKNILEKFNNEPGL